MTLISARLSIVDMLKSGSWATPWRLGVYSALFILIYAIGIGTTWLSGTGLHDAAGRPIGTDFVSIYSAGRMAARGDAAGVYAFYQLFLEQNAIFGEGEETRFFPWLYPPVFLLAAVPLAQLPYIPALLVWLASTFAVYLHSIRTIIGSHRITHLAAAFTGVFVTIGSGQNSFLAAGCLGLGLAMLARSPMVAGIFFGLLCFKPQLGLLLPVILASAGCWSAFRSAAVTVIILASASVLIFGIDPWWAFMENSAFVREALLEGQGAGWEKNQSVFSAARGFSGSTVLAYFAQGAVSAAVMLTLAWLWRRGPTSLNCAAACAGAALATPYLLDYDMMILAPAMAFLIKRGLERGFEPFQISFLAFIWLLPLLARPIAFFAHVPLGMIGILVLFAYLIKLGMSEGNRESMSAPS